jgi:hypothetical protein
LKAFSKERPLALSLASPAGIAYTVEAGWSLVSTRRMLGLSEAASRRSISGPISDADAKANASTRSRQMSALLIACEHTMRHSHLFYKKPSTLI